MQFKLNIIAALLAVSSSTVAAAQKSSNLRGGGFKLHQVSPTRKLQEDGETSTNSPQSASESSPTLDAQDDGCPGKDEHKPDEDDECPAGQIMCFDVNPFQPPHRMKHYCHIVKKVDMDAAVDEATPVPLDQVSPTRTLQEDGETSTNPPQTVAL